MRRRFLLPAALALPTVAGCGPHLTTPGSLAAPVACALEQSTSSPRVPDTLVIGLPSRANPDPAAAPLPGDAGAQLTFGVFYQTLVTSDCEGRVTPGLAREWRAREGGREWRFRLRADARFWDGVPVTAAEVRAAWLARPAGRAAAPWEGPAEAAVRVEGDSVVIVRLARPVPNPELFADPALAVAKPAPSGAWPIGSGPWWPVPGASLTAKPVFSAGLPTLRFTPAGRDARDLIDAGVDLVVTADPAALRYAASRPDVRVVPLPWDHIYVLLSPAGLAVSDSARTALARDAVRVDARAASALPWWEAAAQCVAAPAATAPRIEAQRIVYPRGDSVAGDLAGRLVALGRAGAGGVAVGLAGPELDAALRAGAATAFVIPLPARALDPCAAAADLYARAPWLGLGDGFRDPVVPLVATRRHALVRGAARWTVAWDGLPRPGSAP